MILPWILQLGFIQKDETSGLYLNYPMPTRKVIASQTVGTLLTDASECQFMQHPNFVHTAMEGIGQGFGLPLADSDTIDNLTEIYRRWLLAKPKRPPPIEADEETFFRKIFQHYSLLFEPRGGNVEVQVQLCSKVLVILERFGLEVGNRISTETWELLLKVVLGLTDLILKDPSDDMTHLSSRLCPLLLRVLFQLWIRSQTMNNDLWKALGTLFIGWRHRMPVINHWNNLCAGFTNRCIRLLYGPTEGHEYLNISEFDNSSTTYMDLKPEFLFYAWYRILHLIGEPETINVPSNYFESMKGINYVTDALLNIKGVAAKSPDGNTILHIVGPFLFEAINIYDQPATYDKGKAQAFITVSKIFNSKSKSTNFDSHYLAAYYRGIEQGLKRNSFMISVIINNSLNLFQNEYKGVRMLIPAFLGAIEQILSQKNIDGISGKIQSLRNSCIKILGTCVSLPHHYGTLKFNESAINTHTNDRISNYWEILSSLKSILFDGLRTEEDSTNRQMLMWTIITFLYENIEFPDVRDLPNTFSTLLLARIANHQWPVDDCLVALSILSELSNLFPYIKKYNKDTASQLVIILTTYIETNMEEKKGTNATGYQETIIIKSFYTMLDWIMADKDQWILNNQNCLKSLLKVVEIALTGQRNVPSEKRKEQEDGQTLEEKKKSTIRKQSETNLAKSMQASKTFYLPPTEKIKHAAMYVLMNLMNRLNNFPTPKIGAFSVSSLATEVDILNHFNLSPDHLSVFISDRSLLSVIRHFRTENRIKVTIIIRDETGRYVWTSELNYNGTNYIEPPDDDKIINKPIKEISIEKDEDLLTTLQSWFTPVEKTVHDKVNQSVHDLISSEETILKSKNYGRNAQVALRRTEPPNFEDDSLDFTPSRLFLSHFGLNTLLNFENFSAVQKFNSPDLKFNYLQNFSIIDKTRERETYSISIINAMKGQTPHEIFENQNGSSHYQHFIENIGWLVSLPEHVGYCGGLDPKTTGQYTPYYANYDYEVVFQVSTLMPNKEPTTKQIHKTRLILNSKVLIVWAEDLTDFRGLPESNNQLFIVIHPLPSDLFHIRIYRADDSPAIYGPALDSMIVSKQILPSIVRFTAINASKLLREDYTKPFIMRRFLIDDFISKNKVEQSMATFIASQFTA